MKLSGREQKYLELLEENQSGQEFTVTGGWKRRTAGNELFTMGFLDREIGGDKNTTYLYKVNDDGKRLLNQLQQFRDDELPADPAAAAEILKIWEIGQPRRVTAFNYRVMADGKAVQHDSPITAGAELAMQYVDTQPEKVTGENPLKFHRSVNIRLSVLDDANLQTVLDYLESKGIVGSDKAGIQAALMAAALLIQQEGSDE